MSFKQWYWIGIIWAFLAILGGIMDQTAFSQTDKDTLNQVANAGSVAHVDDAVLGENPINTEIGFLGLGVLNKLTDIAAAATFQNDFWNGDLNIIRWLLYGTIGGALMMTLVVSMAPALLGAIRGGLGALLGRIT